MYCRIKHLPSNTYILHLSGHHYRYKSFEEATLAVDSICENQEHKPEHFKIELWNEEDSFDSCVIQHTRQFAAMARAYAERFVN